MKNVGIFIRVSTQDQAQGESPQHHEERARKYADAKGWNVIEIYHLEGVSGKTVKDNPEARRMMKDVERGHITGLIFSKLARLARNTKELIEFAEFFNQHNADLISLHESIDTSTPTGRLFYRLQASLAEWEREEITERVKAATLTRAQMGKPLGGEAPFGYKWDNKKMVLNEAEAPVRKLAFELFLEHKRIKKVASLLNSKGYRTRRGSDFSGPTIERLLTDPIAKGLRRVNYTKSTGDKKHWVLKPEDQWIYHEAPAIVSEEIWNSVNEIISSMTKPGKKTRRAPVHLFTGFVYCDCGEKMYLRTKSPKYICYKCKRKVTPDTIEKAFNEKLDEILFSDTEIQSYLLKERLRMLDEEARLDEHKAALNSLKEKIDSLFNLYYVGKIAIEDFDRHHNPLKEQYQQREAAMLECQSLIDTIGVEALSSEQVVSEIRQLRMEWDILTQEAKRTIIETITDKIIVENQFITIEINYVTTKPKESTQPLSGGMQLFLVAPYLPTGKNMEHGGKDSLMLLT